MAGYIGSKAVSVNTTSATISDDLAVGDDLTVTDDATIGGDLAVTGNVVSAGIVQAGGGNAPTKGFQLARVNGTLTPRITNDASDQTCIRPGVSGGSVAFNNFANSAGNITIADAGDINIKRGNLVVETAGKGIDFSAQTATSASGASATSELLDHYEEGTFTPTILQGSNAPAAYSIQSGFYTRVGDLVHIQGYLRINGLASMSGSILMFGLPFTAENVSNSYYALNVGYAVGLNITSSQHISGNGAPNSTQINLRLWDLDAGTSDLTAAELSADGGFIYSATYKV